MAFIKKQLSQPTSNIEEKNIIEEKTMRPIYSNR